MNTTLMIKINKDLRDDAKHIAVNLGVPLTTIVQALLKQFVRDRQVTISLDPLPTKKKLILWEAISAEMDVNKKNEKVFSDSNALLRHLKISQ